MLRDLRESKVWQEAEKLGHDKGHSEGFEQGFVKGFKHGFVEGRELLSRELVNQWRADGKTLQQIVELLRLPLPKVRRLARRAG